MIAWPGGQAFPAIDSRGRIYMRGFYAKELKLYEPNGRYVATIGREGDGPGEFRGVQGIAVGPADSLFVFDRLAMRLSVFAPDLSFARSTPMEAVLGGWDPLLLPWDSDHFYFSAHIRTADRIGLPVHQVDRRGALQRSFGSELGDFPGRSHWTGMRVIADAGEGILWAGRLEEYLIERISFEENAPLEVIRRDARLFPAPERPFEDPGHESKPPPQVAAIMQDGDRLWVLTWVTDPGWEDASPRPEDRHRQYDSVIEVIDLDEYRVIARSRFPDLYWQFLGPNRIGGTIFEGGLIPVFHIKKMAIVGLTEVDNGR